MITFLNFCLKSTNFTTVYKLHNITIVFLHLYMPYGYNCLKMSIILHNFSVLRFNIYVIVYSCPYSPFKNYSNLLKLITVIRIDKL